MAYYRKSNSISVFYSFAFMVGVGVIGLLIALKFDIVSLNKEKINSIKEPNIELVISTTDATNISKVYQALKTAKNNVSFLETDIQKVALVDNDTTVRIIPKANITNFTRPVEVKIKK